MQALDIDMEDLRWQALDLPALAVTATNATLAHLNIDATLCELSVLGTDDTRIARLNTDFRGKPTATNVLSWPAEERAPAQRGGTSLPPHPGPDGVIALGDIALSYDTCCAEAQHAGTPIPAHVSHLIVHGVLHLLGYDHISKPDGDLMEAIEVEILAKLGYDDPYS